MKYIKSEAGQQAFKDRTLLTPRQRSAFIQFDGRRSLDEVLQATAGLGVTLADLEQLVERGLLTLADETPAQAPAAAGGVQRAVVPSCRLNQPARPRQMSATNGPIRWRLN